MAQRHPTSSRRPNQKRRDEEAEDAFVATVYEASTWAQRNRLTVGVLIVVAVVAIVGLYSYMDYRTRLNEQAVVQLEQIQQTVSMGDGEQARADLSQFLSRFGGTPHAGEARLLLGEQYLRSDQPMEAVRVLDEAGISLRHPMGVQIETLKARAFEAAGDFGTAEEVYLEVANAAEMDFQRTGALGAAARLRETRGDWAGAAELYERILEGLERGDPQRGRFEMLLAEVEARANA